MNPLTGPIIVALTVIMTVNHWLPIIPRWWGGLPGWIAVLLLWSTIRKSQQTMALLLLSTGAVTLTIGLINDASLDWRRLLESNAELAAFLAAISFLRLLADAVQTPIKHSELPRGPRALWQTLLGAHILGAAISASVMLIMGDRMANPSGRPGKRRALVLGRGYASSSCWSPFAVAMGPR